MDKIYRKTATIKAERFDGSNEMVEKYHIDFDDDPYVLQFRIETMQGWVWLAVGDWIATDVNGEHWPIADDIFKKVYAELPVIPKAVADWIEECKQKHISIGDMLCSERRPEQMRDWMALTPGTYQFDYARYQKYQELVARAWLYGYQVEAGE
ncbi:DUF1642 domain-containing protein [Levilactobacillus brevis]|uniref:DUF1642 domain-containing protein n=1 Tax=Levilactobacillus brevis TaxID=1580 RepID=UPI00225DFE98|nr:DUF1642 domain-containing protein [Levilactobacillus brevis]MCX7511610.1 DUF1642 domain-containing protein [Levilactobacillus brevis]